MALPASDRHVWDRTLKKKDGSVVVQQLDRIVDHVSLDCSLRNDAVRTVVNNILVDAGGPALDLARSIRATYLVFLKEGKLTTLSPGVAF